MYPKEIISMAERLRIQPHKLIARTMTDVKMYKYGMALIWGFFMIAFYFVLGWFQASTTVIMDLIYGILMVLCWVCPGIFTLIVFHTVWQSMFDPETLVVDILVQEEKEYNELINSLWNRPEN